jgi:hypothetical protein
MVHWLIPFSVRRLDRLTAQLVNDLTVVREIKRYEFDKMQQNDAKHNAARRWVSAVNNLKEFRRWEFLNCSELADLIPLLAASAVAV